MNISQSSLEEIALRCQEETQKFTRQAPYSTDYCMELMRRALLFRNPDAFTKFYGIYESLARNWVYQHHLFQWAGEDADYFVNNALTQFYFAVMGTSSSASRHWRSFCNTSSAVCIPVLPCMCATPEHKSPRCPCQSMMLPLRRRPTGMPELTLKCCGHVYRRFFLTKRINC